MNIASANATGCHLDQDLGWAALRNGNVFETELFILREHQGIHRDVINLIIESEPYADANG
jgi:hypothetical protein